MFRNLDLPASRDSRGLRARPVTVPACRCAGRCRCGGLVPALLMMELERECEFFRAVP